MRDLAQLQWLVSRSLLSPNGIPSPIRPYQDYQPSIRGRFSALRARWSSVDEVLLNPA